MDIVTKPLKGIRFRRLQTSERLTTTTTDVFILSSFRLDVRAMPFPRTTASSGDDSFNTERLDEQNSAENIRSSMQKYLQVGI